MTDERSAFENTSPTRSPSHLLQPTSISSLPLMQAIFPSEEQKIENILQQIEEHKQPSVPHRSRDARGYNNNDDSDDYDIPSLASARSNNSRSSIQTINTGIGANGGGGGAHNNAKMGEFFSCFICFGTIQNAVMCPHCSKLGCQSCLRKWLEETRPQCPHCRVGLRANQLVPCRFFADVMQMMNQQEKSTQHRKKELCE